jgi:hemolysin III
MALFFTTFLLFYTLHGVQYAQAKRTLEILDHISIYFLIAVLTLVFLYVMPNSFGITFTSLWGLTALGIIYKIFFIGRWKIFYDNLHKLLIMLVADVLSLKVFLNIL